ncbi:hypothetical protein K438DRAFT_1920290 [Mycena galopus ATCC 62051]|nr:hypothetical protein K438DRAFT_1920290 [Mycena galopus ATCC 62051]
MPVISRGEVSYITGAASGIGRALATMLVGQGGLVIIADLNFEAGSKFASDLNGEAGSIVAIAVKADTTVWEDQLAAFQQAIDTFNRIDYVFANAGVAEHPWLPPFDPETAASRPLVKPDLATADINLTGQLYTAALALQTFERQEIGPSGFRGKLILTASVFGYYPSRAMPLYAASKAGIINFMRSQLNITRPKYHCQRYRTELVDTPIAPDQNLLSDMQLVVDQFQKFLGGSTINGQALSISQDKNGPACELISVEIFKLFGDKTL